MKQWCNLFFFVVFLASVGCAPPPTSETSKEKTTGELAKETSETSKEKTTDASEITKEKDPSENAQEIDGKSCVNGSKRPCYTGLETTKNVGSCKEGEQLCVEGVWSSCKNEVLPSVEICDGLDNNCDGKVDESFTDLNKECVVGVGECQEKGKWVCSSDKSKTECDAKPSKATTEVCDGKDNDCNGQIDESFTDLGKECTVGVGECANKGKYVCSSDKLKAECSVVANNPTTEVCDGKDNNCDGQIDEVFTDLGKECVVGVGECANKGKYVCSANHLKTECDAVAKTATTEVCDGLDNNCNGQIDETFTNLGKECIVGVGTCQNKGTYVCASDKSKTECNVVAKASTTEICDGLDNNCDGQIDEGCSCVDGKTQVCGASSQGECKQGTQTCSSGQWGACVGEVQAVAEVCDGLDNNCDGQIDESFTDLGKACSVGVGECASNGTILCAPDKSKTQCDAVAKTATTEVCDGLDNNCDGKIDEPFSDLGDVCSVGVGECLNQGKKICSSDKLKTECNVVAKASTSELCDGLDNNCDGKIDETFTDLGQTCSVGVGECASNGTIVCTSDKSKTECNAVAKVATTDVCDGLDNNCDGQIDEAFTDLGKECSAGVGECVNKGKYVCASDKLKVECNVAPKASTTEICDGLDNNCDGQIDEGCSCVDGKTQVCGASSQGECKQGIQTCSSGQWGACVGEVQATTEVCDGLDNNCDGKIDEAFTDLGKECSVGVGECVNKGQYVCSADKLKVECNATAKASSTEVCDGLDNNCDGQIDEAFTDLGKECSVGVGECTNKGQYVCSADKLKVECNATAKASSTELCDGLDNDCDGKIDTASCYYAKSTVIARGHSNFINAIAFSPDGSWFASVDNSKINLWNTSTGELKRVLSGHGFTGVYSIAFSSDSKWLVSAGGDQKIVLWDVANGTPSKVLSGHSSLVYSVVFSPNDKTIASGSADSTVKIWDASTGSVISTIKATTGAVRTVAFSSDGLLIFSGDTENKIKAWEISTGTLKRSMTGHTGIIYSLVVSPDGSKLASGSADDTAKIWNIANGNLMRTLSGHTGDVKSVVFNVDGSKLASGSTDDTIKVWSTSNGNLQQTLAGHTDDVTALAVNPSGTLLLSASKDSSIRFWDTNTGSLNRVMNGHSSYIHGAALSLDGTTLVSGSWDKTIKVWDANTGAIQRTIRGHADYIQSVAISPDGSILASGSWDKTIKLWETTTGNLIRTLSGHTESIEQVVFSSDGKSVVSASKDGTAKLWEVNTGTLLQTFTGHTQNVYCVAFSSDGKSLATGSWDSSIKLWDVATGALQQTWTGHLGEVRSVAFSSDGKYLVSGSYDNTAKIWDLSTGKVLFTLSSHTSAVYSVSFSADNKTIVTASEDKSIKFWGTSSGSLIQTLKGHTDSVNVVLFSADGNKVISGSSDQTLIFWTR